MEDKPTIIQRKRHSLVMRLRIALRVRAVIAMMPAQRREFRSFEAGLGGAFPGKLTSGVVLAACDDYYYRNFAITLLHSIERHGVHEHIHLHLCAPSPESLLHIQELQASLKYVSLTWTTDDCRLAKGFTYPTIYFAAVRFLVAGLLMRATEAPVLCIDVDGVAAKPVWPSYEPVRLGTDILVIRRAGESRATKKILASAVGINNTKMGREFAETLSQSLAAMMSLHPKYHVDQLVIHYVIQHLSKRGLQVRDMPMSFADHTFEPGSVLWTTKGWARKESDFYLKAKQEIETLQHPV